MNDRKVPVLGEASEMCTNFFFNYIFEANSYFVAQICLELAPHSLAPSQVYMDELSKRGVLEFIDLVLRSWKVVVGVTAGRLIF